MNLPQDLDQNANDWKLYIETLIERAHDTDLSKHIPGKLGVYIATFNSFTETETRTRYYIGQGNPPHRASDHRSEFRRCKATTRTGKSKLYCKEFLGDAVAWNMDFMIHMSGLTLIEAKLVEHQLATEFTDKYGADVITSPTKLKRLH